MAENTAEKTRSAAEELFSPSQATLDKALVSEKQYDEMYKRSLDNPEEFWAEMATRIDWFRAPEKIKDTSFEGDIHIRWYEDGILNACHNCIDRHLPKTRSGKIMRRILRKIAANDFDNLGDTSTLADPEVVKNLIEGHKNIDISL
jgi:hypothetical protein